MSEIFNYLKKTETEHKKDTAYPIPGPDMLIAESITHESELATLPKSEESIPAENEVLTADTFDLAQATQPMKSVMDPHTIFGEQLRVLRTKLGLIQKQNGVKTILVTSAIPQEGKSFTACALAGVFAQEQGKRVVIIDADMRKTGSGKDFGINGNNSIVGLAQVLQGEKDFSSALIKSTNPEFWFLPSGSLPTNPSELLSSPNFERVLKSAAESFNCVIVDSPPVIALSDPTLIAPLCDTVVLVVRVNFTPLKLILETISRIGTDRICGVVLNQQKHFHKSRYYYQYYHQKSKLKK
jgi:protein-tyrosine kinase